MVVFTPSPLNVVLLEDNRRISGWSSAGWMIEGEYDLALLEIILPDMDGLSVVATVRARHCATPILMLIAIEAVQTYWSRSTSALLESADVRLDRNRRVTIRDRRQIAALSRKQVELLEVLIRRSYKCSQ